MENKKIGSNSQEEDVRKGPWTMEEDLILINHIANHGEGVWNTLAKTSGLKRTGKSCRLRWLNYLRPDVRRGNITPEEQLLIMELHAKWGNRWSKIAKHLPGRTDNEIKNFWRTRIQKHLKQAENSTSGNSQNSELTEQASSGQVFSTAETVEAYSPATTSYQANNVEANNNYSVVEANVNYQSVMPPLLLPPPPPPQFDQSNESYWNAEDLWSMHLLDGDKLK